LQEIEQAIRANGRVDEAGVGSPVFYLRVVQIDTAVCGLGHFEKGVS
jgi:hypothetical protein